MATDDDAQDGTAGAGDRADDGTAGVFAADRHYQVRSIRRAVMQLLRHVGMRLRSLAGQGRPLPAGGAWARSWTA
jgi:hypothetical protein